jgi:hypothetical protein
MECEWCKMQYPDGGGDFYYIKVFAKRHLICSDCYKHLFKISYEKDKQKYDDFVRKVNRGEV